MTSSSSNYVSLKPAPFSTVELSTPRSDTKSPAPSAKSKPKTPDEAALEAIAPLFTRKMLEQYWPKQVMTSCSKVETFYSISGEFSACIPNGIGTLANKIGFPDEGEVTHIRPNSLLSHLILAAENYANERTLGFFKPLTRSLLTQRVYELIASIDQNKFTDEKYLNHDLPKTIKELGKFHRWLKEPDFVAEPFAISLRFK